MLKKLIKRFSILIGAVLTSMLLVFSVTMANLFVTGKMFHEKKFVKTEVAVKKVEEAEKKWKRKSPPASRSAKNPHRARRRLAHVWQ